jgi:hypothetical protein
MMKAVLLVGMLFAIGLEGCKDESKHSSNGGIQAQANASFCHSITAGTANTSFTLVIGSGQNRVSLSGATGECTTRLDGACASVPAGDSVPITLLNEDGGEEPFQLEDLDGNQLDAGGTVIAADSDVSFVLTVDDGGNLVLIATDAENSGYSCDEIECFSYAYSDSTCDVSDPCGWAADGYCDAADCSSVTDAPFDDSADCSQVDCNSIADLQTCAACNCQAEVTTCDANADCLNLFSCVTLCTDTACITDCGTTYPGGLTDMTVLDDCMTTNCSEFWTGKK